jgi:hypothetical protein
LGCLDDEVAHVLLCGLDGSVDTSHGLVIGNHVSHTKGVTVVQESLVDRLLNVVEKVLGHLVSVIHDDDVHQ